MRGVRGLVFGGRMRTVFTVCTGSGAMTREAGHGIKQSVPMREQRALQLPH